MINSAINNNFKIQLIQLFSCPIDDKGAFRFLLIYTVYILVFGNYRNVIFYLRNKNEIIAAQYIINI